ncbi:MAG: aminotransferase class V-fold PLP-dependent enzyme [Myxococcota bacterium]
MTVAGQATVESADRREPRPVPFDPVHARRDFPILQTEGFVFLDSAASAQKPQCVIDAIANCYSRDYANIHRGVYELSARATANFEAVRATTQRFIGAAEAREIIFVRNTTEALNLIASTYGRQNV